MITANFSHIVVQRPEEPIYINSIHYEKMVELLYAFTDKHNIKCNTLLRCGLNLTYNNGVEKCKVHRDHDFEHNQLLICLNDLLIKHGHIRQRRKKNCI